LGSGLGKLLAASHRVAGEMRWVSSWI
jgi:hypothetical protein